MAKVITTKRLESEVEKAHDYLRTHVLFPSGLLGLIAMVVGVLGLLYQLILGTYSWETFTFSSGLLFLGVVVGWGQTKYQQFLLREFPAHFASRMRTAGPRTLRKVKKAPPEVNVEHKGRGLIPFAYVLGIVLFIGLSIGAVFTGALDGLPAFALPWAGFFWAKMFFWKGIVAPTNKKGQRGR